MKKIVISDTHLGQSGEDGSGSYSLLSRIPDGLPHKAKADAKMDKLVKRVEEFAAGEQIELVACGDILDLSLAWFGQAYNDLVYLLSKLPRVSRFTYIIGNHDHHVWTLHCEHKKIIEPLQFCKELKPESIYSATSNLGEQFQLFEDSFRFKLNMETPRNMVVDIAYPSYICTMGDKNFYFTHGHLFGGLYNLTSRILSPVVGKEFDEKQCATLNIALIEFIYWLWGETGEGIGADGMIEALNTDALLGKDSLIKKIVDNGVEELFPDGIVNGLPDSWERSFLKWAGHKGVDSVLAGNPHMVVSKDRYEDPARTLERAKNWISTVMKADLENFTFVFGHTHRAGFSKLSDNIKIINLGGWLVEPIDADPDTELLMIDNEGNVNMERI